MQTREMIDIFISVVTISLAFSVGALYTGLPSFMSSFPIVFLTLGLGFVLHELAHRYVAKSMGCFAFYKAWMPGLVLAFGLALMSGGRLVFAAPGAVHIGGRHLSARDNGKIAAAGPIMNIIIGTLFLVVATARDPLIALVGNTGAYINFFLAAFNLIPFPPLDGSKVIQWNIVVWAVLIGFAGFMML